MKERGIIFSAPMVKALLEGKKTQTRRLVRLPEPPSGFGDWEFQKLHANGEASWTSTDGHPTHFQAQVWARSPYGVEGDRLWVREKHRPLSRHGGAVLNANGTPTYDVQYGTAYAADGAIVWRENTHIIDATGAGPRPAKPHLAEATEAIRWTPSIHMRRRESRLLLELKAVDVERLNEISADDARAEGTPGRPEELAGEWSKLAFARLWSSIHGEDSWGANPWVWKLSFEIVERR